MKILLLTTHLNIGGIGVYTVNLARYLRKSGLDVHVASSGGDLEHILGTDGTPHFFMDIRTKSEFGSKVWRARPVLNRFIRDNAFQLVHAQTRVAQVLAASSGKTTGVPFVSTCHGFFKHRRLSRRLFPCWGEKIIAISDSVRGHLLDDFNIPPDRVSRVYNGIELERFLSAGAVKDPDLMRRTALPRGAMVVGSTGRLSSVKGYKYLVSAFKEVVSKRDDMTLLIVGEGPERETLEKQVRRLGIEDKVLLDPGGAGLEKYLSLLDIFCLPSLHEGLGLSLMEAMAAGRACIASDVGGLSELISHEDNGILVPSEDPKALAGAILRLAEDTGARESLAANARKKAAENFSIENSVAETIEVYKEVIRGR